MPAVLVRDRSNLLSHNVRASVVPAPGRDRRSVARAVAGTAVPQDRDYGVEASLGVKARDELQMVVATLIIGTA